MEDSPVKPRPRHRRRWIAAIVLLLLVAAAGWCGYSWYRLNHASLPAAATGQVFTVKQGESLAGLARDLEARGILRHAWDLRVLARLHGVSERIQAGEYRVGAGFSTAALLHRLVTGDVVMHSFTIIPGQTFSEIRLALEASPIFEHTLAGLSETQIMAKLGHADERAEGRFLPETYDFPRGTSDLEILRRAYAAMAQRLHDTWSRRAGGLVITTPYEALILASIVEKETAVPAERARIAGVFERRLERRMPLGADPTIIYGLGSSYHGDLTYANMARDTPYNTYLHRGLPPTPICMPSLASIEAVLHPAQGTALYFVARGDGTHVFSDTLAEQQRMIRKYQLHHGDSSEP